MKKLFLLSWIFFAFLSLSTAQSGFRQRDIQGLVGHFKFTGNFADATATLPDAVPLGVHLGPDQDSIPLSGLEIGQPDGYLQIADHDSLDFSGAFSISFSIYLEEDPSEVTRILAKSDPQDTSSASYWMTIYPGEGGVEGSPWSFSFRGPQDEVHTFYAPWGMFSGLWTYYTITYDGSMLMLYTGLEPLIVFEDVVVEIQLNDQPVLIGNSGVGEWSGGMDDIAFYRRALTETELYNYLYPFEELPRPEGANVIVSCLGASVEIASSVQGPDRIYTFLKGETVIQQGTEPVCRVEIASEDDFGPYECVTMAGTTLYIDPFYIVYSFGPDNCAGIFPDSLTVLETSPGFPENSLRAWYPFAGNLNDTTGNTGPAIPGSVEFLPGFYGFDRRGILISGDGSYLEFPDDPDLDYAGVFSILMMIQADSAPETTEPLLAKYVEETDLPGNYGLFIDPELHVVLKLTGDDGTVYTLSSSTSIQTGFGNMVAITYDGNEMMVVINEEKSSISQPGIVLKPDDHPLILGNKGSVSGTYRVDDLLLYDRALTFEELDELYTSRVPNQLVTSQTIKACAGESIPLEPFAYGPFLKAVILKEGQILQSGYFPEMSISLESPGDYGTYACLLFNGYGSTEIEIEVQANRLYDDLSLYQSAPPVTYASPGDEVHLWFYVNNNYADLEYEMYHDGEVMENVFRGIVDIDSVTFTDGGKYWFEVINGCERLVSDTAWLIIDRGEFVHYEVPGWDWTGNISGIGDSYFSSISTIPGGGFCLLGHFTGWIRVEEEEAFSSVSEDIFIVRYDDEGIYQWSRFLQSPFFKGKGDLAADRDGNIYVCGAFTDEIDIAGTLLRDSGDVQGYLAKLDPTGDLQWIRPLKSTRTLNCDNIEIDSLDHIYLGGNFTSSLTVGDQEVTGSWSEYSNIMFLARMDTSGNCLWVSHCETSIDEFFGLVDITLDNHGNILVNGTVTQIADFGNGVTVMPPNEAPFLVKYNPDGEALWGTTLSSGPGFAETFDISVDGSARIYMTGMHVGDISFGDFTLNPVGDVSSEIFLARFDPEGRCDVLNSFGSLGDGADFGISYEPDTDSTGYLMGMFGDTLIMGADTLVAEDASSVYISSNVFIARMSDQGEPLVLKSAGVKSSGFLGEISVQNDGRLYFAGLNQGTSSLKSTFAPAPAIAFVGYKENGFRAPEIIEAVELPARTPSYSVYPNPAHDIVFVESADQEPFNLRLLRITGQTVLICQEASRYEVPTGNFTPGLYVLMMEGRGGPSFVKLLIR